MRPLRYDDVYRQGAAWLDELAREPKLTHFCDRCKRPCELVMVGEWPTPRCSLCHAPSPRQTDSAVVRLTVELPRECEQNLRVWLAHNAGRVL